MFPEGETTPTGFVLCVGLVDRSWLWRLSVGVGGVTSVSGASLPVFGGVCGVTLSTGRSPRLDMALLEGSRSNECRLSDAAEPLPKLILLRFT